MKRLVCALLVAALSSPAMADIVQSVNVSVGGAVTSSTFLDHQILSKSGNSNDPFVTTATDGSLSYDTGSISGSISASAGTIKGTSFSNQPQTGSSVDYSELQSQATVYDGMPIPGTGLKNVSFTIGISATITDPPFAGSGSMSAELIVNYIITDTLGNELLRLHYDNFNSNNVLTGSIAVTGSTTLQMQYNVDAFTYDNGISGVSGAAIDFSHTLLFNVDNLTDPNTPMIGSSGFDYATPAPEPASLFMLAAFPLALSCRRSIEKRRR